MLSNGYFYRDPDLETAYSLFNGIHPSLKENKLDPVLGIPRQTAVNGIVTGWCRSTARYTPECLLITDEKLGISRKADYGNRITRHTARSSLLGIVTSSISTKYGPSTIYRNYYSKDERSLSQQLFEYHDSFLYSDRGIMLALLFSL